MTVNTLPETRLGLLDRQHLETLLRLSQAFNSSIEMESLLPRILTLTLDVTESEAGAVWLVDDGRIRCAVAAGPAKAELEKCELNGGIDAVGEVITTGRTLVVADALEDARFAIYRDAASGFKTQSALIIPLLVNGKGVGAIELINDIGGKDQFGSEDIAFLEALADDAAAAVRNAELFEAEQRAHHFQTELNLFGQLFVTVIVMLAIGIGLGSIVGQGVSPVLEVAYSWVAVLVFLVPILHFSRRNDIPLSEFGVATQGWKRYAFEGALFAIPLILLMPVVKRLMFGDTEPLITFARYAEYPRMLFTFDLLFYIPHSFLQELAARGLIQGSLTRFLVDSNPLVAVAVTSAIFGVGHLYAGISFAFLTLVVSFIFGLIYLRQGSLVGVTVTHVLCGQAALAFGLF
ncbi:MAG: GAF domain-containing protein [Gemmatimonadota bacterium]